MSTHGHEVIHAQPDSSCAVCSAHCAELRKRATELAEEWAYSSMDLLGDHSEWSVRSVAPLMQHKVPVADALSSELEAEPLGNVDLSGAFAHVLSHVFNAIYWNLAREESSPHLCPECDTWTFAGGVCAECRKVPA